MTARRLATVSRQMMCLLAQQSAKPLPDSGIAAHGVHRCPVVAAAATPAPVALSPLHMSADAGRCTGNGDPGAMYTSTGRADGVSSVTAAMIIATTAMTAAA
jgi:hypothetical protein